MGPYCRFCDQRCFVHMPMETPAHIVKAYGNSTIIATCRAGQAFEKEQVGYCYEDIQMAIAEEKTIKAELAEIINSGVGYVSYEEYSKNVALEYSRFIISDDTVFNFQSRADEIGELCNQMQILEAQLVEHDPAHHI